MDRYNIYTDIASRTQGDIYIGVVGPVRSGKSTFIKRFMETLVLPNIDSPAKRQRAMDELPQSASGRTIMTTEPKFVPEEAVELTLEGNAKLRVRMIDCVGYVVHGAIGQFEDGYPRMVNAPWFTEPVPFTTAAEFGTKKVINEHSTIGLVVTTDGSIGEIPRESYVDAETRVITELKQIRKPFVVVLNSKHPEAAATQQLRLELEGKFGVSVITKDVMQMDADDIGEIMENVLFEFPVKQINVTIPKWVDTLCGDHWLCKDLYGTITEKAGSIGRIRDIEQAALAMQGNVNIAASRLAGIDFGTGVAYIDISLLEELFYRVIGEQSGLTIRNEEDLMTVVCELAVAKREFDRVSFALNDARTKGYGIVTPSMEELTLEEPEIIKQGGRFGVRLRASAASIHMIRADIMTEVSPIVGSEKQSEELVKYILSEFEEDPAKIWQSNIFGKSLHELVNEGLHTKLDRMPEESRVKLRNMIQRIVNEGSGGLICIIL